MANIIDHFLPIFENPQNVSRKKLCVLTCIYMYLRELYVNTGSYMYLYVFTGSYIIYTYLREFVFI